jgi:hypothetical protein
MATLADLTVGGVDIGRQVRAGVAPLLQPTIDQLRGNMNMIAMVPTPGRPRFVANAPADGVLQLAA